MGRLTDEQRRRMEARDRRIVAAVLSGCTHTELADRFHVCKSRITQIANRAGVYTRHKQRSPRHGRPGS